MIYLDNSATTKPCDEAVAAVSDALTHNFGNPSSRYSLGLDAERLLKESRASVASSLNTEPKNIIFTSGGTESDNLAIFGGANIKKGAHAVTTTIEHPAVLNAFSELEKRGFSVTYVSPDSDGVVNLSDIAAAVNEKTSFVSVMHVNNETGALMPVDKLSPIIKKKAPRAYFHVDAVQSYGKLPLYPEKWGVDFLSVSSHKVHGPKGVGALYKADKSTLHPTVFGGGQEGAFRSGTENMPGIAGFAAAARLIDPAAHYEKMLSLKNDFAEKLLSLPDVELNGSLERSIPYVLNVSFVGIRSEIMLNALSEDLVFVSAGSACAKGTGKANAALRAQGAAHADNAIRFSFSRDTTAEELSKAYEIIIKKLEYLR